MSNTAKEFTARAGEAEVHLKQIGAQEIGTDTGEVLSIKVPPDEVDILVGMLDGVPPVGLTDPIALGVALLCAGLLAVLAMVVCYWILNKQIDITHLLNEADGKASLSRFQALIFTFVLSSSLLAILIDTGGFPDKIPDEILYILAGSLGTYLMSKGIQRGKDGGAVANLAFAKGDVSGPMAHFAGDAAFEAAFTGDTAVNAPRQSKSVLSATPKSGFVPVAVAVGACTFDLDVMTSGAEHEAMRVKYTNASGERAVEDLTPAHQIATLAGKITEIEIFVRAKSGAGRAEVTLTRMAS